MRHDGEAASSTDNTQSRIVLSGKLRVTSAGEVFRITPHGEVPAKIIMTARDRKYCAVTYTQDGKQKAVYVHRLVASAFIPNPNSYPQINHLDGDPTNNAVSNLRWCTPSQNIQHAYDTGLIDKVKNSVPCALCGEITLSKTGACARCRRSVASEVRLSAREDRAISAVADIDMSILSPAQKEYVAHRKNGLTIAEIASICGVSRQCVHQTLAQVALKCGKAPQHKTALTARERFQIEQRLAKKLSKAKALESELEALRNDAAQLTSLLSAQ